LFEGIVESLTESRVALRRHRSPVDMAYEALEEISPDPEIYRGRVVLVKPNAGFMPARLRTGLVTDAETVRGVVRFFRGAGAARVLVGDGAVAGVDAAAALEAAGIAGAAREEGAVPVNLDEGRPVKIAVPEPMAVDHVVVSSFVLEVDLLVSVPVMKSHMNAVASLGIKNLKGCLHRREKQRFHHLAEEERFKCWHRWKTLERAIADLYGVLKPHITVLDGIVGMEGLGPSMGDPKPLGIIAASRSPLAAELVGLHIMGLHWKEVPHVFLAAEKTGVRLPDEVARLHVDAASLRSFRNPFARAVAGDVASLFPHFEIIEGDACSACCATVMAFLKQSGDRYAGHGPGRIRIAFGRNLDPEVIDGRTILLGNCTADFRARGRFLVGCPPVGSDIAREISAIDWEKRCAPEPAKGEEG